MDNSSQASNPNQGSFDPQQLTQQIASSYVDDYMPPVNGQDAQAPAVPPVTTVEPPAPVQAQPPAPAQPTVPVSTPFSTPAPKEESHLVVETPAPLMAVEKSMPPMVTEAPLVSSAPPAQTPTPAAPEPVKTGDPKSSQELEDQNIFHLLGIESATEKEKDMFLDELQQIIWEDFLENDVQLLLTEEELAEFKKIGEKVAKSEDEKQSEMVDFLEKLVPDLEKIMLEKALELKEAMFLERITQMKREFEEKPEALTKIEKAEQLQKNQQWRESANALNAIAH